MVDDERAIVLLVHTGQGVEHLRPGDNRKEHSEKRNVTRKTSIASVPLPLSTTSAATRGRGFRSLPLPPLLPLPPRGRGRKHPHRTERATVPEELDNVAANGLVPAISIPDFLEHGLHLLLLLPSLQGRPRKTREEIHNLTCRPCQNGQGEGRQVVPCGPASTRLPGRTPVEAASVPPGQSASREPPLLLSVPVGRRTPQAPHHGCDAGPRRAPLLRSAARAEATSAAVAAASATRRSQRHQHGSTARHQHKGNTVRGHS